MKFEVSEILKDRIDLPYYEVKAGLVRTHTKEIQGTKGMVKKSFPIYCGVQNECDPKGLKSLTPSSDIKSMFYIESVGNVSISGIDSRFIKYTCDLKVVCWLNMKKLGYEDCNLSAAIQTDLIYKIESLPKNEGLFIGLKFEPISLENQERTIFRKYNYGSQFYQSLQMPYDYFAVTVRATWMMSKECLSQFTEKTPIVC